MSPQPPPASPFHSVWSRSLPAAPRGLSLAREQGGILVRDANHWLHLLNPRGERQAQVRPSGELAAACASDDGSACVAVGVRGEVWWLAPDLSTRWDRKGPRPAVAVALDPLGQYVAAAGGDGQVVVYDRLGRQVCALQSPRPLVHLGFAAAAPVVVGAAEFGLVAAFDLRGRWLWRDGLVASVGSMVVASDGAGALLACFSEGILRYSGGSKQGRLAAPEPCRLVSTSFDGARLLAAGLTDRLLLMDDSGALLATHQAPAGVIGLALGPLGDYAVVALASGDIVKLALR